MEEGRPKIGLALSSGAVRGLAHLGVIEVFEKEGIPIDMIAGTSAGSLVGGLYALGLELKYLKQLALNIRWEHITDITIPRRGLVAGNKLLEFLRFLTQDKTFDQLKIPFTAVATDIERGERVLINSGSVAEAIRASTSIPGIYVPFKKDGRLLVDGAITDRIPIGVVKDMGADVVIAVDVGFNIGYSKLSNIFEILIQSSDIMLREISRERWTDADILIQPAVNHLPAMDLNYAEEIIQAGIDAARNMLPEIKKMTGVD
ncbi:esterase [Anoxybacter fermentans]|uniref:Esterase n=1 Tax=Anoxybacter fermentans TaxID=1323375 RepID=A0A3S9SWM4_9FIRM|nr:patatin-like phospholipase family protein [Anoxybacter fermentans]AZR72736.1 esterase [Anoxybacter fermentans]